MAGPAASPDELCRRFPEAATAHYGSPLPKADQPSVSSHPVQPLSLLAEVVAEVWMCDLYEGAGPCTLSLIK